MRVDEEKAVPRTDRVSEQRVRAPAATSRAAGWLRIDASDVVAECHEGTTRWSEGEDLVGRHVALLDRVLPIEAGGSALVPWETALGRARLGAEVRGITRLAGITAEVRFVHADGDVLALLTELAVRDRAAARDSDGLRELFATLAEPIVVHRDGAIVYANDAALRAMGHDSVDEIAGRSIGQIAAQLPPMEALAGTFERVPAMFLFATGDPPSRRTAASADAERMAALGTLAMGAAHEMNNPMTYVLGNVEYVARKLRAMGEHELVDALSRAIQGIHRMRLIVRNLTAFAQGSSERASLLDVRAVLEAATQLATHRVRERARLVKTFHEVPPIEANEARLSEVFLQLLVNAAHAIPTGESSKHEVRVTTRTSDRGLVVVEVADTGAGIPAASLAHVFEPFFTTKANAGGMGLGLSFAHGVVRDLGGTIEVSSVEGSGTVVRVTLPPARAWRRASGSFPAVAAAPRPRVLLVEDDPLVADAIALILREESDVTAAATAREALDRLASGARYDVILCELVMDGEGGRELYAEALRTAPDVVRRFVFLVGGACPPRARAFLASVQNPRLEKPVDAKDLRDLVRATSRAT